MNLIKKRRLIIELGEIISDAIKYPLNNVKVLLIYIVPSIVMTLDELEAFWEELAETDIVPSIVMTLVLVFSGVGLIGASEVTGLAAGGLSFVGIIGLIIAICIELLIEGYMLDVIKFSIDRDAGAPDIDFSRQVTNGTKYIILAIIYFIIPVIVIALLSKWQVAAAIIGLYYSSYLD